MSTRPGTIHVPSGASGIGSIAAIRSPSTTTRQGPSGSGASTWPRNSADIRGEMLPTGGWSACSRRARGRSPPTTSASWSRWRTSSAALSLGCGAAWVAVAFAARRVGASTARIDGLALALPVAALVTLPFGLAHAGSIDGRAVAVGLVIAVVGLVIPFALELEGLRRLEPRAVAIVYSVDPAIAALVGLLALGEGLSSAQVLGIVAVMAASIGVAAEGR